MHKPFTLVRVMVRFEFYIAYFPYKIPEFLLRHNCVVFSLKGDENGDEDKELSALDNNNSAIFTAFLKLAIDTDRSERLNEMIKTTGFQLYNTYIGGGAGGNNPVTEN